METRLRKSGLKLINDFPWGTHFCQFYSTKQDLLDILVPYFKAGLENNEFCMWICWDPLRKEEAEDILNKRLKNLNDYIAKGQIEIVDYSRQQTEKEGSNFTKMKQFWIDKEKQALERGFEGLRLAGNTYWLEKKEWDDFKQYEQEVDDIIRNHKMLAICPYSLDKCGSSEIIDVIANHKFALIRREGKWEIIESYKQKKAEDELRKLNRILKALSESDQAMMRATNESDYLKEVCNIVVRDCGYSMVWIGFAENDENKSVRPVAQAGFEEGYLKTVNITWQDTERGRGPTGTAIRTGKPSICKNMLTDPNFKPWREEAIKRGYASSIVLPLITEGKVFGAINIYSKLPDPFSEEEVKMLAELSDDLAYGIMAIRLRLEHQQAEEALRRTRDYLESLFNYANAPIICWDAQFKITRFNRAFERLTDYTAQEVLGKDLSILFPEESKEESLGKIRRTLVGEHWEGVEIPIVRKDGEISIVLWNSANVYAEDGKTLLATIAQGQNITARRKIAEALREANEQLEQRVAQRTEELIKAQSELSEKKRLSDIGTLAAMVAHELRNPLAAIKMAVYNIKRKAGNPLLDKHITNIDTKVSESEQIIDNLLFYSRLRMPRPEKVHIYEILNECINSRVEHFAKLKVSLEKDIEPLRGIVLEIDLLQMREVFNNILNNAFEALSEGKGKIKVGAVAKENSIIICIKDNGAGIDKEHLDKIFAPFFTTKPKGTGLGLTVCNQVMRLHGGLIHIESEKGKGTTVTLTLPIKQKRDA